MTAQSADVTLRCMAMGLSSIGDRQVRVPHTGEMCLRDLLEHATTSETVPVAWSDKDGLLDSRGIPITILVNSRLVRGAAALGTSLSPGDVVTLAPRLV